MIVLLCSAIFILYLSLSWLRKREQNSKKLLPPGPWGFPLLGHLPLLGTEPYKKLMEWKQIYGPVLHLQFGSFPTIVLNDIRQASNLQAFNGRVQIQYLVQGSDGKGFSYEDTRNHFEQRDFVIKNLKEFGQGKSSMEFKIHEEVSAIIETIKNRGNDLITVNRMFSVSVVNCLWSILIDDQRFPLDDPQLIQFTNHIHDKICSCDSILNKLSIFLPWISRWMSDLSGHNEKVTVYKQLQDYCRAKIDQRKLTWVKGQARDFTDAYLDKVASTVDPSSSFHASRGLESVSTTLDWFICYMATYPDVQKRIQDEIELVVDPSRLPGLSDRSQMPYTDATIQEQLRITCVVPLGVFHRTLEQVNFQNYQIPKGTLVAANQYAVIYDQKVWGSDADKFRPERFLQNDSRENKRDSLFAFGFGKRVCPGQRLSMDELFLFASGLLQTFDIKLEDGAQPVQPVFGLTLAPSIFKARFINRKSSP